MFFRWVLILSLGSGVVNAVEPPDPLDAIFERIYSFDFATGAELAREYSARRSGDPLGPAAEASAIAFGEMKRLNLFDGERSKTKPDGMVRRAMMTAIHETDRRTKVLLAHNTRDRGALTARMIVRGLERDYLALVEKSYRESWVSARQAQAHALVLTREHPEVQDAWYTIGFSDYLIATVPFVVRPFMKMELADGNKPRGIANLEKAARGGRFLKGFAQLMLANIYRKEKRPADAERTLRELARDYPDNVVIRRQAGFPRGDAGSSGDRISAND